MKWLVRAFAALGLLFAVLAIVLGIYEFVTVPERPLPFSGITSALLGIMFLLFWRLARTRHHNESK